MLAAVADSLAAPANRRSSAAGLLVMSEHPLSAAENVLPAAGNLLSATGTMLSAAASPLAPEERA